MTFQQVAAPAQALFAAGSGWQLNMANTLSRMIAADVAARAAGGTASMACRRPGTCSTRGRSPMRW